MKGAYEYEEKGDLLIIGRKTKSKIRNSALAILAGIGFSLFSYYRGFIQMIIPFIILWLIVAIIILLEKRAIVDNINKRVLKGNRTLCSYDEIDYVYTNKFSGMEGGTGYQVTFKLNNGKNKKLMYPSSKKTANEISSRISQFASLKQGELES